MSAREVLRTLFAAVLTSLFAGCAGSDIASEDELVETTEAALTTGRHRYYAAVFGMEDGPNSAAGSHSFAAYIRAAVPETGAIEDTPHLDITSISWLPASYRGAVCVDLFHLRCPPERGRSFTLEETFAFGRNRRIAMWGPFEIREELYLRAQAQERRLGSGAIRYVANDFGLAQRSAPAINCVHALTNVLYFERLGVTWGIAASRQVVVQMLPWVIDRRAATWVEARLPLPSQGITRLPL